MALCAPTAVGAEEQAARGDSKFVRTISDGSTAAGSVADGGRRSPVAAGEDASDDDGIAAEAGLSGGWWWLLEEEAEAAREAASPVIAVGRDGTATFVAPGLSRGSRLRAPENGIDEPGFHVFLPEHSRAGAGDAGLPDLNARSRSPPRGSQVTGRPLSAAAAIRPLETLPGAEAAAAAAAAASPCGEQGHASIPRNPSLKRLSALLFEVEEQHRGF
mmetsp:Transcript_4168/g.10383  ORF Transcript_4168/g.10383 Transcript_4168/m.10383 type:complete len:217 (+) Transcript_4168:90-740(+)